MAKGNRKRSNKEDVKNLTPRQQATSKIDRSDVMPIQQNEAFIFKELIDQSNMYGKLLKQYEDYEFQLQDLIFKRKQVQQGKIKLPIYLPLIGNALYCVDDKKRVLKDLDTQIKILTNSRDGIKGQMTQRRDMYVESALRLTNFMKGKFGKYSSKDINVQQYQTGVRVKTTKKEEKKNQEKLFEAEFNDLMKDAQKQAEFHEAAKKAQKKNEEQKVKVERKE